MTVVAEPNFKVIPLGGLGEIGMNCLIIEAEGRLLLIDCGVMFPGDDLGIDVIHPGFEYLWERQDDIEAVVLTHGHEDHITGLPFLLREIDLPVYGGNYALGLLKVKVGEMDYTPGLMARKLHLLQKTDLGPFSVTSFPMPHSIIQNTGLLIQTPAGRILHTGDFKLGMTKDGGVSALATLTQMGDGEIDLMTVDSTGAEEPDVAGEETTVAATLNTLFKEARHRVFVAIFSSNIQRMASVIKAATRSGRRIALCGRSVQNHFRIARASGGINIPTESVISLEDSAALPRSEVAVIVSGTQGEGRSALNRISRGTHHVLSVEKDDLVVLSSRFIPGNELAISAMIDRLLMLGARVIHRGVNRGVHVSGHGGMTEIRAAIDAVRPRCYLPVHGTFRHLTAGAAIAQSVGIANIDVAVNGQTVTVSKNGIAVGEPSVPVRRVFVDRGGILSESIIRDRRILASNGSVTVTLVLDEDNRLHGKINATSRGVVTQELMAWFADEVQEKAKNILFDVKDEQCENLTEVIRTQLRKFVSKLISREPLVTVTIIRV